MTMTTTTTQIPQYDRDAFRRRVSYVRDIESLAPVMSDELRAAVNAWRPAHTAAIAAGDYSDPAHTAMDAYATDLRAAIRGADHLTAVCHERHTTLVELAAGPTPFRPMDPAAVKTMNTALGKIGGAVEDLDMRAAFLAWVPRLTAAYGRQDVSAPSTAGGPASTATDALSGLLNDLAATGVDGA